MTLTDTVNTLPTPRLGDVRFPEWKKGLHTPTDGPDSAGGADASLAEAAWDAGIGSAANEIRSTMMQRKDRKILDGEGWSRLIKMKHD